MSPRCHAGLFVGVSQSQFLETLSIFGDKCPRNGSKNGEMAPRTGTGYLHIGPFVDESENLSVRRSARAEDAQGTPAQSHISPNVLEYTKTKEGR